MLERIDAFVEAERSASGLPGVALAIVDGHGRVHVRGFGHDGRGTPIDAGTPFPIGSLTKSFTALLVRQAAEAGSIDVDAPVRRYLPWFPEPREPGAAPITSRHLLNQTSGFSRASGVAALVSRGDEGIEALARALAAVAPDRPPGERYEYSNVNFVLLGAILEAVTGRSWQRLVRERILVPSGMTRSHASHEEGRRDGMTTLHRIWFGVPVATEPALAPGLAPTGSLVSSATDMSRYLGMLLAGGTAPGGRVASPESVNGLLSPASPPGRSTLMSEPFEFRYGEGWFVGPFGTATDARWHLGSLPSFTAWMVVLPERRQAVAVLVNAGVQLPFGEADAVMGRLPVGVVALLHDRPPPRGPSLREAYLAFDLAAAAAVVAAALLARRALRSRRVAGAVALASLALATLAVLHMLGASSATLRASAPDLALTLAVVCSLLALPAVLRAGRRIVAGVRRVTRRR